MTLSCHDLAKSHRNYDLYLRETNQSYLAHHQQNSLFCIIPHARTLRKAREQVKIMVEDGNSTQQIRKYLRLWSMWWVQTSEIWNYQTLLTWFLQACWENNPAKHYATGLLHLMKKDMQITHERVLLPQQALNHQAQTV